MKKKKKKNVLSDIIKSSKWYHFIPAQSDITSLVKWYHFIFRSDVNKRNAPLIWLIYNFKITSLNFKVISPYSKLQGDITLLQGDIT